LIPGQKQERRRTSPCKNRPQGGGKDVFVHISAVERAGLSSLNEGQVIEYEEVANRGKTSAENLKVQR
jgi:cold shock protein